jgi:nitroimidazol reductase NimA-like FMN-containing flavoprotein (pyridoxamine 5'-phosphate oxidase superfamily)
MSTRDQIKMTPEEVDAFLQEQRTMSIATIGKDGRPHLIAMWYALFEGVQPFSRLLPDRVADCSADLAI